LVKRIRRVYIPLHDFFATVQGDFVRPGTDIAIIGIGHFSGAIDNAAHDPDFESLEVVGRVAEELSGFLQVKEGTSTAWTGDILCFGNAGTGRLQNTKGGGDQVGQGGGR